MKKFQKIIAILAILFILPFALKAQPGNGGFDDEPEDAPIDGGIIILTITAAAYGFKKLKKE